MTNASPNLPSTQTSGGVAGALQDQSLRWRQGEPVLTEDYLRRHPELAADPEAVLDLIYHEILLRERHGEAPDLEEYLRRFPHLSGPLRFQFEVHEAARDDGLPKTRPCQPPTPEGAQEPALPGYEILGELGRGGMGIVWKARHRGLNRIVALKMMLAGPDARPEDRTRFRAEAEAMARLQHPSIVQVFEVGEHDQRPYFAMEHVEGGALTKRLNGTPLPPRDAAALLEALARAVQHAHDRGVVHRDLKPGNILLQTEVTAESAESAERKKEKEKKEMVEERMGGQRTGRPASSLSSLSALSALSAVKSVPKIADFGLAKRLDADPDHTRTGSIMGTPSYMAPEQAEGRANQVGPAADIYALGAILFELLTGRPPFQGTTLLDTLEQVRSQEPVPPRRLVPKVPRDLETVCLKCLQKEPAKRFASAAALADDLRCFLDSRPIRARPTPLWERAWKWSRRRPVVAVLAAALIVALVLGFAGIAWQWRRAEARALAARQSDHIATINLAQREWKDGNVPRVLQLLARPGLDDLHGFEWHYLDRLCHGDLLTVPGRRGVAFHPDGNHFAAPGTDDSLRVWNQGGQEIARLAGISEEIAALAFNPDGTLLATAGTDGLVRLWDWRQGGEASALPRQHSGPVAALSFSPDGKWLASGSQDRTAVVWDMAARKPAKVLHGHKGFVQAVAFGPDGRLLATAGTDGVVKLWRWQADNQPEELKKEVPVQIAGLAFDRDGERLAVARMDGMVAVWDVETHEEVFVLPGHKGAAAAVAFSPDGRFLATGGWDRTVRLWSAGPGRGAGKQLLLLRGHTHWVTGVAFDRTGNRLASADSGGAVKLWDATARGQQDERVLHQPGAMFAALAYHPNGRHLATGGCDKRLRIWDVAKGTCVRTLAGHAGFVNAVAYSPDGSRIVSASEDGTLKLWDAGRGELLRTFTGHKGPVLCVAIGPEGKRIASGGEDHSIRLWDADTGEEVATLTGHEGAVNGLAYSPDGKKIASASRDGTVRLWEVTTGSARLLSGHIGPVTAVAFSPDGKRIASAGEDHTVRLWRVRDGREEMQLPGHDGAAEAVAFNPADSRRLVSAGADQVVKVWDLATGQELLALKGCNRVTNGVAFRPDGNQLAAVGGVEDRGELRLWDAGPRRR